MPKVGMMEIEQDYIMHLIKEMIKVVKVLICGRREPDDLYDLPEHTELDAIQELSIRLADKGYINDAEDLLFSEVDEGDITDLYLMIRFYEHLNTYTDEFLNNHQYSREEVMQGIIDISKLFNVADGVLGLMLK